MKLALMLLSVAGAMIACVSASPNLLFVHVGSVRAQGRIVGRREEIDIIDIDVRALTKSQRRDLWVGLSETNQIVFADISESTVNQLATSLHVSKQTGASSRTYYYKGYAFTFSEGQFLRLQASRYGFPPHKGGAYVLLGSRKKDVSVSLPASIGALERIFGRADEITRGFGW